MRFLHTADIHLGAEPDSGKPWSGHRKKEIWSTFERIMKIVKEQKIDLLLIAGDLFHRQPFMRELKEVNYLFASIAPTKVVFILGNHDYVKKDSYYHQFIWNENVTALIGEEMERIYFQEWDVEIYGFSYHKRKIVEPLYDHVYPENKACINILLGHGGDAEHIPISRKNLAVSGFDYIALGHIHKPEIILKNKMAYSGAPEPLDINDVGVHGCILGEVKEQSVSIQFQPIGCRSYIHAKIDIKAEDTAIGIRAKIEEQIAVFGIHNIYKIILEGHLDPDISLDLEYLESVGNIIEVVNQTEMAYDIETLKQNYKGHMIARYIEELEKNEKNTKERKALHYGIKALLEAKK